MKPVPANRFLCFFLFAIGGLSWDLYSKSTVFNSLGYPASSSDWVQTYLGGWTTFCLYTNFNPGALWGIGQDYTWLFSGLSVVAAIGVIYWLFVARAARSLWLTVSLALIMAGTLGNLYDRLGLHGCVDPMTGSRKYAVRDFLLLTFGPPDLAMPDRFHWPVFNFADVFLVTGAIMLVLQSFKAADNDAQQTLSDPFEQPPE